jgi:acyl transferase domain-containing protein
MQGVNENAIAVIGMSCRFPDAPNPEHFWSNLRDGRESVTDVTADDLLAAGYDPAVLRHPGYVGKAVVLDGIDRFDASLFGFSPRDAEILDPQHRLFLESAWEALEDAGYDPWRYSGPVGVFGGVDMSYYLFQLVGNPELLNSVGMLPLMLANEKDHLATRVAYKLNLKGPAVTVQSACSTSLLAICYACQSLLDYHCDLALAGGSAISVPQGIGYVYQEGGISSPDGHCRAFDASAQGTVGGSGAGLVVLKRLADAIADRDHIRAVIRGYAINNDGSNKVGYTAPSVEGQSEVIAMAQAMAGVSPESISYIEAHGTGTALGDPIEVAALTKVFRAATSRKQFCGIGSVKTNIGHLNSAAGVAGVIKTVLALENQALPPSLHFERPNPNIDFENSPFYVVSRLQEWPANGEPRRAGVSSFGIGGTNAHMILEEIEGRSSAGSARPSQLLTLSAKTTAALVTATAHLSRHLGSNSNQSLADVAYTLAVGRRHFDHRRTIVVSEVNTGNIDLLSLPASTGRAPSQPPNVVFLFPGQGSQHVGMGRQVYESEPVYREQFDACADAFRSQLDFDLRDILFTGPAEAQFGADKLRQTGVAQPVLFAVEYALAKLWMSWGIHPTAMLGHSIGEYVAACIAGVMTLEDALSLVALRGKLMQQLPSGSMLAATLPVREMARYVRDGVSIAAINSPTQTVISGPTQEIESVAAEIRTAGFSAQLLQTSHAFHSSMMDFVLEAFHDHVRTIRLNAPTLPYLSNVTGSWATSELVTEPRYWCTHLRNTVRFEECISTLSRSGPATFLEVGPGRTLSSLVLANHSRTNAPTVLQCLPPAKGRQGDSQILLESLGRLWIAGCPVDWTSFYAREQRHRVSLPTYPFERQRYWVDALRARAAGSSVTGSAANVPLPIDKWFYQPVWERSNMQPSGDGRHRWLMFAENSPFSRDLIVKLENAGQSLICVTPGELSLNGEKHVQIEPGIRAHYTALLTELSRRGYVPDRVVHLWNVDDRGRGDTARAIPPSVRSFESLLYFAQAAGSTPDLNNIDIRVVSTGLHSIDGTERLVPETALLLGPCRVLPQESAKLRFSSIDIRPPGDDTENRALFDALLSELLSNGANGTVAWRGSERWIPNYRPFQLPPPPQSRLRKGGVYLITGGMGGIGLAVADYLARNYSARLVLLGRSALPDRDRWPHFLSSAEETDRIAQGIRRLIELEKAGAEVLTLQADVANAEQMREVATRIEFRFGGLNGIIHCAGIAGGGMALLKKADQAWNVIGPKVYGTRVLRQIFGSQPLDFVALCSSLSAMLGGFGQVDYCAANCALDAFAHQWDADKTHVVSINWDTWGESGMAVNTDVPPEWRQAKEDNLRNGIRDRDGGEAFARIVGSNLPQVLVSTTDFFPRMQTLVSGAGHRSAPTQGAPNVETSVATQSQRMASTAATHPRPNLSSTFVPPSTGLQQDLAETWQELLGVSPIGSEDDFLELGGHSLLALQLVARIRESIGVDVSIPAVFENPTIAGLAAFLETAGGPPENEPELVPLPRELRSRNPLNGGPSEAPAVNEDRLS